MLEVGGGAHHLGLELTVARGEQLLEQALEYDVGRYAMAEELVEAIAHGHDALHRLLLDDEARRLLEEELPVGLDNLLIAAERIVRHIGRLAHEESAPQVALRLDGYLLDELVGYAEALELARLLDHGRYLLVTRRRHAQAKTTTAHRRYHATRRVAHQNETTRRHVLLHGATQSVLGVLGQLVHFRQHHN